MRELSCAPPAVLMRRRQADAVAGGAHQRDRHRREGIDVNGAKQWAVVGAAAVLGVGGALSAAALGLNDPARPDEAVAAVMLPADSVSDASAVADPSPESADSPNESATESAESATDSPDDPGYAPAPTRSATASAATPTPAAPTPTPRATVASADTPAPVPVRPRVQTVESADTPEPAELESADSPPESDESPDD